ncbi:hypothetical protein FGO68_gene2681 [Halteria grandinella]|uniref:Uncharacterized protein n=1 Tax=Halteria grandinella TaxID=5974 RepID=A0A8J8SWK2_HALGN|nr:hypothetical protein FGO68_gene2681 [Halteria grandinella]
MNLIALDQHLKNSLNFSPIKLTVYTIICLQSICARCTITPGSSKHLASIVRDSVAVAYLLKSSNVYSHSNSFSFLNLRIPPHSPSKEREPK